MSLASRYRSVAERIARSAQASHRTADEIILLAVSKGHPVAAIRELALLGQRRFAENYLQEAQPKMDGCRDLDLEWHFIGPVQSNKSAAIAAAFDWVQTLDREKIARRLNDQRPPSAAPLNVCLQVNLDAEPGKAGVNADDLEPLARRIRELPRLRLRGLMAIPAPRRGTRAQRRSLRRLKVVFDKLCAAGYALDTLSMGMSADLEAAVAEGATMVRVGTDLLGPRELGAERGGAGAR